MRRAVAKVRVYELAKELGIESKVVMAKLNELGEFVRSASSTVEPPVVRKLRELYPAPAAGDGAATAAPRKAAAKKAAPASVDVIDAAVETAARRPGARGRTSRPRRRPARAGRRRASRRPRRPRRPRPTRRRPARLPRRDRPPARPRPAGPRPGNNPFASSAHRHGPRARAAAAGGRCRARAPRGRRPRVPALPVRVPAASPALRDRAARAPTPA